jgi:hypothetical protein
VKEPQGTSGNTDEAITYLVLSMALGSVGLTRNLETQQQYTDVKAEYLSCSLHIHFHCRHEKYGVVFFYSQTNLICSEENYTSSG